MSRFIKISPGKYIVLGFASVILLGVLLLSLPIAWKNDVRVPFLDTLFTSVSAVCVTGLLTVDIADNYSVFGQIVVALLIQTGGLGFASIGVGFILLTRSKISFTERVLVKESLNLNTAKGVVKLVRVILLMTLIFESIGTIINYIVFSKVYPPGKAMGVSIFHAISSFNNAGIDILGGFQSLSSYQDNILLNLNTIWLIVFGGLGFFTIKEILKKRCFKKFTLHTKVVITMSIILLFVGTLIFKLTEDITWLGALFTSTSSRTAGFSTYSIDRFSDSGLFILTLLMFIGASPGSTGGGIKTTTMFILIKNISSIAKNKHCTAFKREIPKVVIGRALNIIFLALTVVCIDILLLTVIEQDLSFVQIFFEVVSAIGTVGLSTGITPQLQPVSKIIIIITMFIGRIGLLTVLSALTFRQMSGARYSEETLITG